MLTMPADDGRLNQLESDSGAVLDAVRAVEVVGAHAEADEHLAGLEGWEMVAYSYALETASDVLDEAGFLEGVPAVCEVDREV